MAEDRANLAAYGRLVTGQPQSGDHAPRRLDRRGPLRRTQFPDARLRARCPGGQSHRDCLYPRPRCDRLPGGVGARSLADGPPGGARAGRNGADAAQPRLRPVRVDRVGGSPPGAVQPPAAAWSVRHLAQSGDRGGRVDLDLYRARLDGSRRRGPNLRQPLRHHRPAGDHVWYAGGARQCADALRGAGAGCSGDPPRVEAGLHHRAAADRGYRHLADPGLLPRHRPGSPGGARYPTRAAPHGSRKFDAKPRRERSVRDNGPEERIVKLLIQWVISVVAIAITVRIVPGISVQGEEWKGLAIAAVMLGLANLLIRPILTLITAPITAVTLGLFWFVVGAIVLAASSWLSLRFFSAGIVIDCILSAILGALIIAIITGALGHFLMRD